MFKPNYRLTNKLVFNIAQIERLYGNIEVLRIPQELEINLERNNLINSSYISNSIEGNPLSLPEVTNLLLGDRVPINRNEKEVKNYFDILKNLNNYVSLSLSLTLAKQIHQKLLTGVNDQIAGKIRNTKVVVGKYVKEKNRLFMKIKHEPPFHLQYKIEETINDLFIWMKQNNDLSSVIMVGIFHHQFVYIHPFDDGNGRTCRLLTALIFLKTGYLINKYFVLDDYYDIDRHLYSDKLHTADLGDKTEWLEYFSDGLKYSLQGALAKVNNLLETTSIEMRPTPREKEVMQIFQKNNELTSAELTNLLHISRQQVHNLLKSLINKGLLIKKGKTKRSYYLLKTSLTK